MTLYDNVIKPLVLACKHAMNNFDAYGFYEQVLKQIAHVLLYKDLPALIIQPDGFVRVAQVGFDTQQRNMDWNDWCESFALAVENDSYGLEALADYEDWAVGICCFAAFSIGVELALSLSGELSETDRFLAAAILPGFIASDASSIVRIITPSVAPGGFP